MTQADIKRRVEKLAERLALSGSDRHEDLDSLREEVEAIRVWCVEHGFPDVATIASSADEILTETVEDSGIDPDGALVAIRDAVHALQSVLLGGDDSVAVPPDFEEGVTGARLTGSTDRTNPFAHDIDLLIDFINEASEHIDAVEGFVLNLERGESSSESFNGVFRAFHTIKGVSGLLGLDDIARLSRETEDLLESVRAHSIPWSETLSDAAFDSADEMKVLLRTLRANLDGDPSPATSQLERVLRKLTAVSSSLETPSEPAPEDARQDPASPDSLLTGRIDGEVAGSRTSVAGGEQSALSRSPVEVSAGLPASGGDRDVSKDSIRVDARKLDRLLETIGELVITTSVVREAVGAVHGDVCDEALKQLEKISAQLQDVGATLRMVPLRNTFRKLSRLVRNLGRSEGKPVDLVLSGEDCELDRTIVDRLSDSLVHIIRNAIDHGIEGNSEDRIRAGKPARGRIDVRAFHRGGGVVIEIEDDGRGFDTEAIARRCRELGIVEEGELPTPTDLHRLVFHPGFSTAETVTDISGRGVGMDVVKENVESLRGQIEIFTESGRGTRLSIQLPLTIATIDGMVVAVGEQRFVLPTASILRTIRPTRDGLVTVMGRRELVEWEGSSVPLIHLARIFGVETDLEDVVEGHIVIVEQQDERVGLVVDELLGQRETVIKNLGGLLRGAEGISGGAIMPDGSVGLILDIAGLVRLGTGQDTVAFSVRS